MASVQMSQRLRDDIANAYEKQLHLAYRKEHNVQPAVDYLMSVIQDDEFNTLVATAEQYENLSQKLEQKHGDPNRRGYYNSTLGFSVEKNLISKVDSISVICNPNRPQKDNMTILFDWSTAYQEKGYDNKMEKHPCSDNYVEGDTPVRIEKLQSFMAPVTTRLELNRGWGQNKFYAPYADCAYVITEPKICEQLMPIGQIEDKAAKDLQAFKEYIAKITTLKRFLDEWPGGKDLVPEEDIQRMTKKVVRKKSDKNIPEKIIPDILKEQMNEVILTNKLLGD
tara:strand:- start:372 stop:1214 length:843 start_codon:yes stop_codon:yes gene_type:complete